MTSWLITLPQTVDWETYKREIETVKDGTSVMNYRIKYPPRDLSPGDHMYITYKGQVRGWMNVVGVEKKTQSWQCTTTGKFWQAGTYIQRSGPFHEVVDGEKIKGFRGIRRFHDFKSEEQSLVSDSPQASTL
jgi:hypothetical protein